MVSWRAVLLGMLILFLVSHVLAIVFYYVGLDRTISTLIAMVAAMVVGYRIAQKRKWLNAILVVGAYSVFNLGLAFFIGFFRGFFRALLGPI